MLHKKRGGTLRGGYGLKYDVGILILRKPHLLEYFDSTTQSVKSED